MSHREEDRDPFTTFTGDRAAAAQLRANLARVAEQHPGTGIARIAHDVLAGRRPVRDLGKDAEFSVVLHEGIDAYRQYRDSLTPDERAQLVRQAVSEDNGTDATQ